MVSTNSEELVATHEQGAYQAIPEQDYRDGSIKQIALHYFSINRVVEKKAVRHKEQEDNVRAAELNFMLDLKTLNKETSAAEPDLIELNYRLKDNQFSQISNDKTEAKKLPTDGAV